MSFFNRAPLCARSILFLAIFTSLTVLPAGAQINTTSRSAVTATSALLTLAESFQLALAQQPWTLAASERQREQQSREALADSWLADSPTIASGLKTGNRDGLREFEVEISAPIATLSLIHI